MNHLRRSALNTFALWDGDRHAERRGDERWIRSLLDSPSTRLVPVWRGRVLVVPDETAAAFVPARLWPRGPDPGTPVLLGERGDTPYFAREVSDAEQAEWLESRTGAVFRRLHRVGSLLDEPDASVLAYAQGMVLWHARHRFCGRCGARTLAQEAGHIRFCEACERREFPRLDPAVIVLVEHAGRCLLGRQPGWDAGRYSCVAGFVEPGETLEAAVMREVFEETGVRVGRVVYQSSQPWPFPSSIMLGFRAEANDAALSLGDELEDARWFSRDQLRAGLVERSISLSPPLSIAFRLIEDWYDEGTDALRTVPNWRSLWPSRS